MIVLDASIALGWCFPDEGGALVEQAIKTVRSNGAVAPPHFATEVANGLVIGMLRNRLSDMRVEALVAALATLDARLAETARARGVDVLVAA